jgi:hypothetical protein
MVTFFSNGPAVNLDYKAIRDQEHCKPYRDFLEYLWARYDPSGDGNECFLGDAKKNFRQRFWEMYLFCALEDRGIAVQKTTDKCGGPDFSFEAAGKKYWVEAIVPGPVREMTKCHFRSCGLVTMCQEILSFYATPMHSARSLSVGTRSGLTKIL